MSGSDLTDLLRGGAEPTSVALQRLRLAGPGDEELRRFGTLAGLLALGWALCALTFFAVPWLGPAAVATAIATVVVAARAWVQHVPERFTSAVHAIAAASALGMVALGALGRVPEPQSVWYLGAIPLVVGHLLGPRATLAWAAVSAALVPLTALLPELVDVQAPTGARLATRVFGAVGLVTVITGFTFATRRTMDRQLAAIQTRERHIRQQARALEIARDEALDAARAKAEFLASMSHEIRTPLNGVIGMTALLARTPLADEQRRMVGTLERSGRALLSIVNEILDLSKLEAGGVRIARGPWSVRHVVDEVVALVAPTAADRGLTVHADVGADVPPSVVGDGPRVRQVLLNLVGNAIKFTDHGGVSVHASLTGARLRLAVRDSGVGIPADKLPSLFDAFTQVSAPGAEGGLPRPGGTGLGLAISRRLARMMGGDLEVESALGRGSTFTLVLPLEPATPDAGEPETLLLVDPTLGERAPLAILLAEDTAVNREVIVGMLEAFGYHPDVAVDGPAVLNLMRQRRYDLVLMDLRMPGLDGLEVTRRLRADFPADAQPRVYAMTANVLPEHRVLCRDAGMDGFIGKPVSFEDLGRALAACGAPLAANAGPAPAAAAPAPPLPAPLGRLLLLVGGDRERLADLASSHIAHAEEALVHMAAALAAGDLEALGREAHSLKSSAAMFGEHDVSALAAGLEAAADAPDLPACAPALDALGRAVATARVSLTDALAADSGAPSGPSTAGPP